MSYSTITLPIFRRSVLTVASQFSRAAFHFVPQCGSILKQELASTISLKTWRCWQLNSSFLVFSLLYWRFTQASSSPQINSAWRIFQPSFPTLLRWSMPRLTRFSLLFSRYKLGQSSFPLLSGGFSSLQPRALSRSTCEWLIRSISQHLTSLWCSKMCPLASRKKDCRTNSMSTSRAWCTSTI